MQIYYELNKIIVVSNYAMLDSFFWIYDRTASDPNGKNFLNKILIMQASQNLE